MDRSTAPRHQTLPEVFPDRVAAVHRPGRAPLQLLMFGSGILAGLGLPTHNAGLPGAVADGLAARSGRGVDLTVVVDADPTSERAATGLLGLRLHRFDSVIVVLGDHHAANRTGASRFSTDMEALARLLTAEVADRAPIFVYDSALAMLDVVGERSRRVRSAAEHHTAISESVLTSLGVRFKQLMPPTNRAGFGSRFSSIAYQAWGEIVVERLRLELAEADGWVSPTTAEAFRRLPDLEPLRQEALDTMRLDPAERDEIIDFLVRQAKVVFRAAGAAVNVIDHDLQWQASTTQDTTLVAPRGDSYCDVTIRSDGLTLINDAERDARVRERAFVKRARFYAGYPIHTWDGYRIGALCIWDPEPREMAESELSRLRDFAGRIEEELWAAALKRISAADGSAPTTQPPQVQSSRVTVR
ncbi:MAG TPA: hypothetical protein VIG76_08720 [Amnibacterium sp.]|uniref:hypothetical protein n=1 Tax=Amnibacterium sp. TaxID=1872496 RepID=UPI002F91FDF7